MLSIYCGLAFIFPLFLGTFLLERFWYSRAIFPTLSRYRAELNLRSFFILYAIVLSITVFFACIQEPDMEKPIKLVWVLKDKNSKWEVQEKSFKGKLK